MSSLTCYEWKHVVSGVPATAANAARAMNGKMVDGKPLVVRPRSDAPGKGAAPGGGGPGGFNGPRFGPNEMDDSKLYVAHLAPDVNEDVLARVFGPFGQIMNIRIITDRDTGQSKGYAFITYSDQVRCVCMVLCVCSLRCPTVSSLSFLPCFVQ
jgi:RNA recognition motif-containing protein